MAGYYPRLTLEVVISEPVEKIKKIVIKWEGYAATGGGEVCFRVRGYLYNWSNLGHRLVFKDWIATDKTLRFVLLGRFGKYVNDEGRMRFVVTGSEGKVAGGGILLCTDFFEVTVCYED